MLKPKRKITRKEIQRDPFLETVDKLESNINKNKKLYINIIIGLMLATIAFNIIKNKRSERLQTANSSLGRALVAIEQGDLDNARFQLETIILEYDGETSASTAGYYLGKISFDDGDFGGAKNYLVEYMKDHPIDIFVPGASKMLAAIAVINGDSNAAEKYLDNGIAITYSKTDKMVLKLEKARIILNANRLSEARSIIKEISSTENIPQRIKQKTEELHGMLPS
tara:strand:+ start:3089 stop:3763 length:675 start_codon:yes stop_codon:yes gene_type:complete